MNGNVWRSARIKKAYEIHLWKTCSLSCETPVQRVIQFVLVAVAKTNGIHASASHPDLVARGGEPPNLMSDQ